MKTQKIRLTENDLHRIIKESVKNILMETGFSDRVEELLKIPQELRVRNISDEDLLAILKATKENNQRHQFEAEEEEEAQRELEDKKRLRRLANSHVDNDSIGRTSYVNNKDDFKFIDK